MSPAYPPFKLFTVGAQRVLNVHTLMPNENSVEGHLESDLSHSLQ